MEYLTKLFKIVELTRSMPQTGYALAGIATDNLSNLAEHHYLVAFIAWQLARNANRAGAKLDLARILEYALVHDIGEILGADISTPYARANRKAYKAAKVFEKENQKFLGKFFGHQKGHFRKLADEILDAKSDEALVAKMGDFLECTHYKLYVGQLNKRDLEIAEDKLTGYIKKMKDPVAKKEFSKFVPAWLKELPIGDALDIISQT